MRKIVANVLVASSVALALFIVYAHLAAIRTARQYSGDAWRLRFDGESWAEGESVRADGVSVVRDGGRLRVRSSSSGAPARFEVRGPARRLTDSRLSLRFRVHGATGFDAGVGLERVNASGDAVASVAFGLRNDHEQASFRFFGDELADAPEQGDHLEAQRFVPFEGVDEEHEVTLIVRPDLHAVLGLVDGASVSSHVAGWDDGLLVRPVVFVRSRSAGEAVDVEIAQADELPMPRDTRPRELGERFDGPILDPVVWSVLHADGWRTDGSVTLASPGLDLRGHALRPTQEASVVGLVGPTRALGSFRTTVRFSVKKLHHARFYVGVSNLLGGLSDWRVFEAGLGDGTTQIDPYVAGHWEGDGQLVSVNLPGESSGTTKGVLELDYDAATGVGVARLNGRVLTTQHLDFEPPESAHLELGARVVDKDGAFDLRIEEVRFEPRTWTAGDLGAHAAPPPSPDASAASYSDAFTTDTVAEYHVLAGAARWGNGNVQLGPDAPVGDADHELVRGFFDRPVTVSGSVFLADDPVRGPEDSVGVMATDYDATTRYTAVLWYGARLPAEFHISRETRSGTEFLARAPARIERNKSYWVKLRVERNNVYARYWPNVPGAGEPADWTLSVPIREGWTATGGVGFTAHATKTWATELRAE